MGLPPPGKGRPRPRASPCPGSEGLVPGQVPGSTGAGNQVRFFPDVSDNTTAAPTLGRIPTFQRDGPFQGLRSRHPHGAAVTCRARPTQPPRASRPGATVLSSKHGHMASQRPSGAGLLPRTNNMTRTNTRPAPRAPGGREDRAPSTDQSHQVQVRGLGASGEGPAQGHVLHRCGISINSELAFGAHPPAQRQEPQQPFWEGGRIPFFRLRN